MPCFNCGPYILKALESFERGFELLHLLVDSKVYYSLQNSHCAGFVDSVLVQGLAHVKGEVVVVDDASTDNSTRILENFMDQHGQYSGRSAE